MWAWPSPTSASRQPCIDRQVLRDRTEHLLCFLIEGMAGLESGWKSCCRRPRACVDICSVLEAGHASETLDDTLVLTSSKCYLKDSVLSRCALRWGLLEFQELVVNNHV